MRALIVIPVALFLVGCGTPCTQIKATRCLGNVVEICGSNGKWQRVLDCNQIKPITPDAPSTWVCGKTTIGNTCVPKGK